MSIINIAKIGKSNYSTNSSDYQNAAESRGWWVPSRKALALSIAAGGALFTASQAAAGTVTVSNPDDFESALSDIVANGTGANSLVYNGPSGVDLSITSDMVLPGQGSSLEVTINPSTLYIGDGADASLTVGRNSSISIVGNAAKDIIVGNGAEGALIIDGGTVNLFGSSGPQIGYAVALGAAGGSGELIIRNGGVLNMRTDADADAHAQLFAGYDGVAAITLDNGQINFGAQGASMRLGLGRSVTVDLLNGSVIDSSRGASHFWVGEWSAANVATVNITDSSLLIIGGGTNTAKDERAFAIGYVGGNGVVNQNGDDSYVHVAGIYRIGIGEGNGSSGVYNLNGGLLEIGTEEIHDAFRVGVNVYQPKPANLIERSATAVFNVNGGTAKLHGDLRIADSGWAGFLSDATVNINGGKLTVGGEVHFGAGTGKMNLNGGVLELGGTDAITGSGAITFAGGTIRATSDLSIAHAATINAGGARFDSNAHSFIYSGILSGAGGVIKEGDGTLLLTGANTYTGGTTVTGGTLETGHANALGTAGGRLTLDGGTLKLTTVVDLSGGITAGAGNGVLNMATHDVTLGGASDGAGGVTFTNGNLSLAGTLAWHGATVLGENATLTTTATNQLSSSSTLRLASTGTLENGEYAQELGGLAGSGTVNSDGALSVGSNNTSTQFDGQISGEGQLRKVGEGTLTLTSQQTYIGGTVVEAGSLVLAGGGKFAEGSDLLIAGGTLDLGGTTQVAGEVALIGGTVSNGVLNAATFDLQSGDLNSAIAGTGALIKSGSGSVTLGGLNSAFSGSVAVQKGELRGAIGAFGTANAIQNNGLVTFIESGAAVWNGAITGSGSVGLTGGGAFEILGDASTYSGRTLLQSGSLRVNGTLANSTVVVSEGATLGGNGTVGGLIANGMVAPGNSIGTLHIAGDVTFDAGAIYQVEVDAAGNSDLIAATGSVVIDGGEVQVLAEVGQYERRTNYTILTAAEGITGGFDSVSTNYAFLTPTLTYGMNEVGLQLDRNDQAFGDITLTANELAAAAAVEQLGYGNPVYDAILFSTGDQARTGFAMLSGEVHASIRSAMIEDSRHVRAAMDDRLTRSAGDTGVSVWTAGFGSWGEHNGAAGVASLDRDTWGVFTGVDAALGTRGRLGILVGHGTADLEGDRGSADVTSYHLGVYGGIRFGGLGLQAGVAQGWHDVDTSRAVDFNGFLDALGASYDATATQVFGGASYTIPVGASSVEPFGQLAYVRLSTEGFDEDGGPASLSARRGKSNVTFSTLGLRLASAKLDEQHGVAVRGSAAWRHAFKDRLPTAQLAFAESSPFTVVGAGVSKDAAVVEAGVDVALSRHVAVSLAYSGQFGDNGTDHGAKASLTFGF